MAHSTLAISEIVQSFSFPISSPRFRLRVFRFQCSSQSPKSSQRGRSSLRFRSSQLTRLPLSVGVRRVAFPRLIPSLTYSYYNPKMNFVASLFWIIFKSSRLKICSLCWITLLFTNFKACRFKCQVLWTQKKRANCPLINSDWV